MAEGAEYFWLEVEMLDSDRIMTETTGGRKRQMIVPRKGKGMPIEMQINPRYLRTRKPVGLLRCSKRDDTIFKIYVKSYQGTGRKYATSIHLAGKF